MLDDWKEEVQQPTVAKRVRAKAFVAAGVQGSVRLHGPSGELTDTPSLAEPPYGGTATACLSLQASWQTESRAARVATIFAAHAAEICAEIDALDSLPDNATVVETMDRR